MSDKEIVQEIAHREPVPISEHNVHASFGGPGWWVAIGTLMGVVAILLFAVYFAFRTASSQERRSNDTQEIVAQLQLVVDAQTRVLEQLQAQGKLTSEEAQRQRDALRLSADCLFIRGRYNERPAPCKEVNARVDQLRRGTSPFTTTTTTRPGPTTTSPPVVTVAPPLTQTTTTATTQPPALCVRLLGVAVGC